MAGIFVVAGLASRSCSAPTFRTNVIAVRTPPFAPKGRGGAFRLKPSIADIAFEFPPQPHIAAEKPSLSCTVQQPVINIMTATWTTACLLILARWRLDRTALITKGKPFSHSANSSFTTTWPRSTHIGWAPGPGPNGTCSMVDDICIPEGLLRAVTKSHFLTGKRTRRLAISVRDVHDHGPWLVQAKYADRREGDGHHLFGVRQGQTEPRVLPLSSTSMSRRSRGNGDWEGGKHFLL
mmetsp:Transcript_163580/g.524495  ORF Transcript_163580/g.524495 Transcript_163580/m.524495 type:complete len:237 (+) Transcript_163580:217-927(+)